MYENAKNDIQTQTEEQKDNSCCESCNLAMSFIKKLVNLLEAAHISSCTTNAKQFVKNHIYEITQSESMAKFGSAIENDVKQIVSDFYRSKLKLEKLENELHEQRKQTQEITDNLDVIKSKNDELIEELSLEKNKHEDTIQIKNNLYLQNTENEKIIINVETKIKNYEKSFIAFKDDHQKYVQDRKIFSMRIENLEERQKDLTIEKNLWIKKFEDIYLKQESLKIKMEHLQIKNHNLKCEMDKVELNFLNLEENFKIQNKNVEFKRQKSQELLDIVQEMVKASNKLKVDKAVVTDVLILGEAVFKDFMEVEGDPLQDMKKQIDNNDKKIDFLRSENEKLFRTLRKYEKIRSKNK